MKMIDKLKAALVAACIEYHWWFILRFRARGNKLLDRGEPLTSRRLLRLSRRIDRHSTIARRQERYYEENWVQPLSPRRPAQPEASVLSGQKEN